VIDPWYLANDVAETTLVIASPGILGLFLFAVAWEDPDVGRAAGFDRRIFWLLLPMGVVTWVFGTLPFFVWDGNILAVNVAGGLIPVVLSLVFLDRVLEHRRGALAGYLGAFAAETAGLFAAVVLLADPFVQLAAVLGVAVLVPGLVVAAESGRPSGSVGTGALLALTSGALVVTFLTTSAVPGVGIVSTFPLFVIGPIAAGAVAVVIGYAGPRKDPRLGLPIAFGATTFGTLVGADVLRQPPLYGSGQSGLLSIGGAGLLDLLFLSGLLAAAAAYALLKLSGIARAAPPPPLSAPARAPTAEGSLQAALDLGRSGRPGESIRASAATADLAAREARSRIGAPAAPGERPWAGLGIAPWIEADDRNLASLAARAPADRTEAGRAWMMSRWLVRLGHEVGRRELATAGQRGAAFLVDTLVTIVPAVVVWIALAATSGPGALDLISYTAAAVGYSSYAFLYFVLGEWFYGTTPGKRLLGLWVVDRSVRRPGLVAVLLRNAPKLIPLSVLGIGGALVTALALGGSLSSASSATPGVTGSLLALEIAALASVLLILFLVPLGVGWLGIQVSAERQRFGDYLAGTWVIRPAPRAVPIQVPGASAPPTIPPSVG